MRISFIRGFGPYLPGVVHDLEERLAEIHIRGGRARLADDAQVGDAQGDDSAAADQDADEPLTTADGSPAEVQTSAPAKPKKPKKPK